MAGYIAHISRSLPENRYHQKDVCDAMKRRVAGNRLEERIINSIYTRSGIETRHSVLAGFLSGEAAELYDPSRKEPARTAERNRLYEERGRELFIRTGQEILKRGGLEPSGITHLITISCTGFYAPGPDYDLIRSLGLRPETERYHLGFMGCYASISGLKLASRICSGDPDARVMVISTELCTLHFQQSTETDDMISSSVFADGSAGTLVTSRPPDSGPLLRLKAFASTTTDHGAEQMAWSIGNHGFRMVLSTYIPDLLAEHLPGFLDPLFSKLGTSRTAIRKWAVHPGGRRILDRLEEQLMLGPDALKHSRAILRDFGNMSSATTLMVLDEVLREPVSAESEPVIALAFGPGLTIECGWMEKIINT